jgi:hypothetical protein
LFEKYLRLYRVISYYINNVFIQLFLIIFTRLFPSLVNTNKSKSKSNKYNFNLLILENNYILHDDNSYTPDTEFKYLSSKKKTYCYSLLITIRFSKFKRLHISNYTRIRRISLTIYVQFMLLFFFCMFH